MKLFTVILVLLLSCKSRQSNRQENNNLTPKFSGYSLPTDKEINLDYETYDQCVTHYFFATDTMQPRLSRLIGYDEKGNEKEVVYYSYEAYVPATSVSYYDSLGRQTIRYYRIDEKPGAGKLSKTTYEYDEKGRLIKSISYDFERRIRKDVDKGLGRPGGCIVTEEDYEKYKSWEISSEWNFKYDEAGKLVEKFAPILNSSQNRYTYKYDKKARLVEERSLEDERLIWIDSYTYYDGGYEYTTTGYENGQRSKNWKGEIDLVDTSKFKIDQFGNLMEEIVIEEGGRLASRHKKYYDQNNRIIREELFDENDKLLGFYVHKYQVKAKPIAKNFFVDNN